MRSFKSFALLTFFIFWYVVPYYSFAQEDKKSDRQKKFTRDSIPELDLTPDSLEQTTKKKKKVKKRIFYGLKCKKGWTRSGGSKEKRVIETFYFLKEFKLPDPYIKDLYVYDPKEKQIIEVDEINSGDKNKYKILHGPYKKTLGKNVVEQGIFYVGMKHARWEKFGKNNILLDKSKFYKGWQKDAEITYYDASKKKVKEVLPYKFGALSGTYYSFLENGQVLQHGKYKDDKKIGVWVEYFKDRYKRRKEIQYPKDPYNGEQIEPFTLNEWNEKGDPFIKNGKPFSPTKSLKKSTRPPSRKK